jgi:hypothetical protein
VRAFNGGSVALSRVSVQTGNGLNGLDGATPPDAPVTAPYGFQGDYTCQKYGPQGGNAPGVLAGGAGGAWWDPNLQLSGHDGASDPGVPGGIGAPFAAQNGGQGAAGKQGSPGAGGPSDLNRASLIYEAVPGNDGTAGTRGAGGGGGAGSNDPCLVGSSGGAGGRPGAGGDGGVGGGGSIGVFAGTGSHVLVLDASMIHTGNGGKGGVGMAGQAGGAGGPGGPAGIHTEGAYTSHSGAGGNGGYGGHGGQGGGGAGGASIGVLAIDSRASVADDTAVTLGTGGAGGYGGYDGKPGAAQKTVQVTTLGGSLPATGDFDGDGIDDANDACPIAAGAGTGCPAQPPAGPVAGDPIAAATGSTTAGSGTVAVSVLPTPGCVDKRVFSIRINARKAHIKTARLVLDGHRLKLVKRSPRRWIAKADLRHSTRTTHTLTIRGTLRSGKRFKQTRRYRTCP